MYKERQCQRFLQHLLAQCKYWPINGIGRQHRMKLNTMGQTRMNNRPAGLQMLTGLEQHRLNDAYHLSFILKMIWHLCQQTVPLNISTARTNAGYRSEEHT